MEPLRKASRRREAWLTALALKSRCRARSVFSEIRRNIYANEYIGHSKVINLRMRTVQAHVYLVLRYFSPRGRLNRNARRNSDTVSGDTDVEIECAVSTLLYCVGEEAESVLRLASTGITEA